MTINQEVALEVLEQSLKFGGVADIVEVIDRVTPVLGKELVDETVKEYGMSQDPSLLDISENTDINVANIQGGL